MLYVAQILLSAIFVAACSRTPPLFNPKAFAITLVVTDRSCGSAAQARAHMKAKIFYVDPDSSTADKPEKSGSTVVRGRAGIKCEFGRSCYRPVPTAASAGAGI